MGELKGGEGRSREATTANLVRLILADSDDPEEMVERILVRGATPDLYAVQIWRRGDPDPESFFVSMAEHFPATGAEPDVTGQSGPEVQNA